MLKKLIATMRQRFSQPPLCDLVDEKLEAYLDEALPPSEAWVLTTHIQECAHCRALVQTETRRMKQFRGVGGPRRMLPHSVSAEIRHNVYRRVSWRLFMQRTKRNVQAVVSTFILILLTAAVFWWWQGNGLDTLVPINPPIPEQTEASLTLAVPDGTSERYRTLVEVFMADNEGITVHVESMNRLTGSDPNPARSLAQAADIFPSGTAFAGDWQSLTLDLTPLANAADFDANDFPAGLLYAADGTMRHLPAGIEVTFIAYNKALFDNAGLAYPAPDWTWEEFVSLATQLTERYGDFTAQYGWADGLNPYGLVGAGLSEPLADYTTSPPIPRLAEDEVVTAVTRYLDLFGEQGVAFTPRAPGTAYGETQSLIQERRVAMWLASSSNFDSYSGLEVGVVPLPIIGEQTERRLYLFGRGFAVSAATQQPQAAWRLLEFLSRQPGYHEEAMPARASVRQATGFWDSVAPEMARLVEDYLERGFALPYAPTRQALDQAIASTLLTGTELSMALAEAETAVAQGLVREDEPLTAVDRHDDTNTTMTHIVFSSGDWQYLRHQVLAQAFEQEHPNLRIEVQPPHYTVFSHGLFRSLDRVYGGRQADCFLYRPLQTQAEIARVLPLDALIEIDPNLQREEFYAGVLNAFTHDGMLVALPDQFRLPLIGYDSTLFDAANIPYPETGWTLPEFLETAVALTSGEGRQKQYGYVPHIGDSRDAWLFLHAFGVDLLDRSADPPTARFDIPVVAEALQWYVSLSEVHSVKPVYRTNNYDYAGMAILSNYLADRRSLFGNRRGAMWWNDGSEWEGPYATPTAAIEERQYTTFPVLPSNEVALPAEMTGLYISAETENRDACWQWITFLLEHDPGVGIPARRTMTQSEEFRLRAGPAYDMMLYSAEQMSQRQATSPPEWMSLPRWYSIALTRALEEDMTAEESLAITQIEFELYRQCVIDGELFELVNAVERVRQCAATASPYVILSEE
jgi:ABC-type glycerol-3-phosphate transport system substrate-binding protein